MFTRLGHELVTGTDVIKLKQTAWRMSEKQDRYNSVRTLSFIISEETDRARFPFVSPSRATQVHSVPLAIFCELIPYECGESHEQFTQIRVGTKQS
jgi:hypothetical protein